MMSTLAMFRVMYFVSPGESLPELPTIFFSDASARASH